MVAERVTIKKPPSEAKGGKSRMINALSVYQIII